MATRGTPFGALDRRQRAALRTLLVRSTAAAGRTPVDPGLGALSAAAPLELLPAAAALHRVTGSVRRGLDGAAHLPAPVEHELAALVQQDSLHHLLVTGALGRIGAALDAAGLRWVVMKGPAVAARLYPEPGDRSYADLDLLVGGREFPAAVAVLEGLGFAHRIRNWALAEDMLAGQVTLAHPAFDVDLHWHLHYAEEDRRPFALRPEELLDRADRVSLSGVVAPVLDPVDTLLTLAFHAARSDGHRLVWLKDVERSLAVDRPDLDELVRRCRAADCGPPVGLLLARARRVLGADVPDEAVEALVPPTLRATERLVLAVAEPVPLHEDQTLVRAFTRSVRSSPWATLAEVPPRVRRAAERRLRPAAPNETSDPREKASYLRAVARAAGAETRSAGAAAGSAEAEGRHP